MIIFNKGQLITLTATIKNSGNGTAYSSSNVISIFYLSLSNTTGTNIVQISYESGFIPNSRKNVSGELYIPNVAPGEYNIVSKVDPYNRVYEGGIRKDAQVFQVCK